MGIFDKIGGSEVFGSGKPLAHGKHAVRIKEIIQKTGRGQKSTEWWIVELVIEESATHAIGETRSWVVDLGQASGPGNVKGFLLACAKCVNPKLTPESLPPAEWAKFAEAAAGPGQSLRGRLLNVEVFPVKTREGKDFSKHVWSEVLTEGGAPSAVATVAEDVPPPPPPAPPAAPFVVTLPPALVSAVKPYKDAGHAPAAIVSALSGWATAAGFTPAQLQAAAA